MEDKNLIAAATQVRQAQTAGKARAVVKTFFDEPTYTATHVVYDPKTMRGAVIDSVLDYDPASGRTSKASADCVIAYVKEAGISIDWHLETHAHADHVSAAPYLQQQLGGKLAIGEHIKTVQGVFGKIFNFGSEFARDGSQFDKLFCDGDHFSIGDLPAICLHVPGHTPADITLLAIRFSCLTMARRGRIFLAAMRVSSLNQFADFLIFLTRRGCSCVMTIKL